MSYSWNFAEEVTHTWTLKPVFHCPPKPVFNCPPNYEQHFPVLAAKKSVFLTPYKLKHPTYIQKENFNVQAYKFVFYFLAPPIHMIVGWRITETSFCRRNNRDTVPESWDIAFWALVHHKACARIRHTGVTENIENDDILDACLINAYKLAP